MAPRRKKQKLEEDDDAVNAALAGVTEEFHHPEINDVDAPAKIASKGSRSLFVRSLPESATNETLAALFSESYPLKHVTIVTDKATKKSKGFAFVTFADSEDATKAKEEFNGTVFEGKKIKVEVAERRQRETEENGVRTKIAPGTQRKVHGKVEEPHPAPRLIIRNLPWSIKTPDQLSILFRSYGKVKQATLPTPKKGLSSGFGFVLLRGRKNAEKAIAGLNGKEVDGRTVTVDYAMDKTTWDSLQAEEKKKAQEELAGGKVETNADATASEDPEDELEDADEDEDESEDGGVELSDKEDEDDDDEDQSDNDIDDSEEEDEDEAAEPEDYSGTLFIRNLTFTATDESLCEHFKHFGPVRYARVVMDYETNRSRGTAFVCFYKHEDATKCLRGAPKTTQITAAKDSKSSNKRSILEDTHVDPFGHYTFEGRVLQISRAVDRNQAQKLEVEGEAAREKRDRDKRRLYLLSEGTVSSSSPLYNILPPAEIKMREDSSKQRQALIKSNPSLHLSLTRLSIRNIPRHITSKDLKALAREAVVGFATDVKAGKRLALTKEELSRGAEEMKKAEQDRKLKGKGIVKQAKIVFEGREGGKVSEESGAGKSRGYGFIEYTSHRVALMGLRWLNGHLIKRAGKSNKQDPEGDKPRRLIVEFAIENAQVVARRSNREEKDSRAAAPRRQSKTDASKKRKADGEAAEHTSSKETPVTSTIKMSPTARNMIGKKRAIKRKFGK